MEVCACFDTKQMTNYYSCRTWWRRCVDVVNTSYRNNVYQTNLINTAAVWYYSCKSGSNEEVNSTWCLTWDSLCIVNTDAQLMQNSTGRKYKPCCWMLHLIIQCYIIIMCKPLPLPFTLSNCTFHPLLPFITVYPLPFTRYTFVFLRFIILFPALSFVTFHPWTLMSLNNYIYYVLHCFTLYYPYPNPNPHPHPYPYSYPYYRP